ncbi:MAG: CAP domain-containing protein [Verrucomicrobia bacterium]|nr:CAP domain-containing protein [Verrucomicrobiota bacterium]
MKRWLQLAALAISWVAVTPLPALDPAAATRALERETNRVRQRAGLPPLEISEEARTAARWQVDYLSRINRLSHSQPGARLRDVGARLAAAGANARFAGENVASNFVLNYEPGRPFYPRNDGRGRLIASYTPNGPPLAPHTPESFAAAVVSQWLNSRGHRRNLLAPEATHMACAIAFASPRHPDVAPLGRVFAVQVLLAPQSAPPANPYGTTTVFRPRGSR